MEEQIQVSKSDLIAALNDIAQIDASTDPKEATDMANNAAEKLRKIIANSDSVSVEMKKEANYEESKSEGNTP